MIKKFRIKKVSQRKNFFPTLITIVIILLILAGMIYFVNPDSIAAVPLFFILLFSALFLIFSIILENSRRGLIISLFVVFFLILRLFGIGNILNLLLLSGLSVAAELYFSKA